MYAKVSDLSNLQTLKERLADPEAQARLAQNVGEDKVSQFTKYLENVSFDQDTITFGGSPVGDICLKVVEREEPKLVKLEAENTPLPITIWIQLAPVSETSCKLRVTLGAEVNMFMRAMVSGPLTKAANGLADMLALIA